MAKYYTKDVCFPTMPVEEQDDLYHSPIWRLVGAISQKVKTDHAFPTVGDRGPEWYELRCARYRQTHGSEGRPTFMATMVSCATGVTVRVILDYAHNNEIRKITVCGPSGWSNYGHKALNESANPNYLSGLAGRGEYKHIIGKDSFGIDHVCKLVRHTVAQQTPEARQYIADNQYVPIEILAEIADALDNGDVGSLSDKARQELHDGRVLYKAKVKKATAYNDAMQSVFGEVPKYHIMHIRNVGWIIAEYDFHGFTFPSEYTDVRWEKYMTTPYGFFPTMAAMPAHLRDAVHGGLKATEFSRTGLTTDVALPGTENDVYGPVMVPNADTVQDRVGAAFDIELDRVNIIIDK